MINLMHNNKEIPIKWHEFSDGALTCKVEIEDSIKGGILFMNVSPRSPVKQILEEIGLVFWSLHQRAHVLRFDSIELNLPYLSYARADRIFEQGNPNGLKYFLGELSDLNFDKVHVCDPHNPKALEGYDIEWEIKDQLSCFKDSLSFDYDKSQYDYVVAPDKGAVDKAKTIADWHGIPLLTAAKKRDIQTGRILSVDFDVDIPVGGRVLVCDDIGDYCGTHIALAKILKDMGATVDLYVTHLIAPKGLKALGGIIDKIYAYHTVGGYINQSNILDFNKGDYGRNLERC